jgi:heavy metal sensor kinase
MSLTNRVSIFFLAALGIILALYSLVYYSVTREHLRHQFADELRGILGSLIAAAEVEETEVKWQPLEHSIDFGVHDEFGEVEWVVVGDQGKIVERARTIDREFLAYVEQTVARESGPINKAVVAETVGHWDTLRQQLAAPNPMPVDREPDEFDQLTVVVGRSTIPRDAILFRLMLLVTILPLLTWLISALLGRWVVRKALRPLAAMANQAQAITGQDFQARLTHSDAGDELTELGTAFNRLLDRQESAFEQQRRFAGDAAHELRTPLTVLLGQIELTQRRPRSVGEYQANLELLHRETGKLQEIVESLLFLARSSADAEPPQLRLLELKSWLTSQAESWKVNARAVDVQLDLRLSDKTQVRATPALLGRVADNLVFNALKYSEAGTAVVVRAEEANGAVLLQVIDSGPGIPPDDLPQLFDPFFRSSEARRRGIAGTGLGLAIARRIAMTLGGRLECSSTLGQGSCFTLALPVASS